MYEEIRWNEDLGRYCSKKPVKYVRGEYRSFEILRKGDYIRIPSDGERIYFKEIDMTRYSNWVKAEIVCPKCNEDYMQRQVEIDEKNGGSRLLREFFCLKCNLATIVDPFSSVSLNPIEEVRFNVHGWGKCPNCLKSFKIQDESRYLWGVHRTCGQRIRVV